MDEKKLPRLQLILVVLFAAAALFGPLLIPQTSTLILLIIILGLLLSAATLWIGWRVMVQKRPVQYPFYAWSLRLGRALFGRPAPPAQSLHGPRARSRRARQLGVTNLVLGVLLLMLMIWATFVLLFS